MSMDIHQSNKMVPCMWRSIPFNECLGDGDDSSVSCESKEYGDRDKKDDDSGRATALQ